MGMKKLVSLILCAALLIPFLPAEKASAAENISVEMQAMIELGVITGYGDGIYKPNATVTRGEFATFLYRAFDLPEGPHAFTDVNKSSSLAKGINAAAKAGIVKGTSATKFSPGQQISREQMSIMISRTLDYKGAAKKSGALKFLDKDKIGASAVSAVQRMVGHGIISGYKSGSGYLFKPQETATRNTTAVYIYRTFGELGMAVPKPPVQTYTLSEYEKQVITLTNAQRTARGLKALSTDVALSKVARIKSQDMKDNNYFSHQSPTYGSPFDMMERFGIGYSYAGENIAMGQTSPSAVVNAWMNSQGHRENILNPNFTHIGVGHVSGTNHWTQMFIKK